LGTDEKYLHCPLEKIKIKAAIPPFATTQQLGAPYLLVGGSAPREMKLRLTQKAPQPHTKSSKKIRFYPIMKLFN
jgi:hypothetical protein